MSSVFNKDILRSIRGSLGRFFAIMGIVALGCGFYAGLRMTAPDMDLAADAYYDRTDLMDIRVVSTLGLDEQDIEALRGISGVDQVMAAYETDAIAVLNDEQYAVRIHSLPYATEGPDAVRSEEGAYASEESASTLNKLSITDGRLPLAADECVISADNVMSSPVALGDKIELSEGSQDLDDAMSVRTFTVVGFAHSPYYVSTTAMGSTSLGSGTIDQFLYVPKNAFCADFPFTEAFVSVRGAEGLFSGSDEYQTCVDGVIKEIEGIAPVQERERLESVKADAQKELDDKRADLDHERADAEQQLADAKQQLDDAASQIEASRVELEEGQAQYSAGVTRLSQEERSAEGQFADAEALLDQKQQELDASLAQLAELASQLDTQWAAMGISPADGPATLARLKAELAALDPTDPRYAPLMQQVTGLEQLIALQAYYDQGQSQAQAGAQQLEAGRRELAVQRSQAEVRFAQAEAELEDAAAKLSGGRAQLAEGEEEYQNGLAEYEENRAKADAEFADAEQRIAEAQAKIDDITMPEWLIMDRTKNPGVVSFGSDADRVDSIAAFFPFIFFLVAALVALTTMTRMVEEERQLIGTFKALGYSKARIMSKYLIYALLASGIGSILGVIALCLILPPVIMEAYAIIYSVPHAWIMPISPDIALMSIVLGVGVTLFSTWFAVASTLRETPAQLMLPRAPKEGKRILLERIRPIWRHLSFSWKVTFRNIFRYKKRLVMTVIGIAGCTGLLLTGFGLYNAINDIIDKEFTEIVHYNVQVSADDDFSESTRQIMQEQSDGLYAYAHMDSMLATGLDDSDVSVSLIVPENDDQFSHIWTMRTRLGHETVPFDQSGVLITEKLGSLLGIGRGDYLTLSEQDSMGNATSTTYDVPVSGVVENYVANYVFMDEQVYQDEFGNMPVMNTFFASVQDDDAGHEAFRSQVSELDGVKTISFNKEIIDSYRQMLSSVNMIVVVLVVAAAVLAFIVLYNLTNINITERKREIATLKVLGFTPHEVDMYIYREIALLTILGALIGLLFGVVLESFVIVTAEVDYVMFGREIHALSFVIAFIVTLAFALIVMLFMKKKLANVDMIESLKSVE